MRRLADVLGFGRGGSRRLLLAALLSAATAAAGIALTAVSAWLIARAAERPPVLALLVAVTSVRALAIARGALRYLERLLGHDAAFRILVDLRAGIYEALERLAPTKTAELRSGDLLARFVADVDGLADLWLRLLLPVGGALAAAVGAAVVVAWLLPVAGLVLALSSLAVVALAPTIALLVAGRSETRRSEHRGRLAARILDVLRQAPELLVLGAAPKALAAVDAAERDLERAEARSAFGHGAATAVSRLAVGLGLVAVLVAALNATAEGSLAPVALAVVALTPLAVGEVLAVVVPAAQLLPRLASEAKRVFEVVPATPSSTGTAAVEPLEPTTIPPPLPPITLRVEDLVLQYPGGPRLLGGLSFVAEPGSWLLIHGPSASGKSSLGAALVRLLTPVDGRIDFVGRDRTVALAELEESALRELVVLGFQDPHIFDASLADNLRLARPTASDGELREALQAAGLGPWLASLPDGLATALGEHGARLSGGQRQRLEVARVVLSPAPIAILDEPTEHLDPPTAEAVLRGLRGSTAGRTVIALSHRLATLRVIPFDAEIALPAPAPPEAGAANSLTGVEA